MGRKGRSAGFIGGSLLSFALCAAQIPPSAAAPQAMEAMAADAGPSFEVATIKPGDPDAPGHGVGIKGRSLSAQNVTLKDMLVYAYDLQIKQIAGEPAWADKDRFDIAAVPDVEGTPSPAQMKSMCRKLLADRFRLTFHTESRELPAYILSVAKSGPKLPKNDSGKPGPGAVRMMMAKPGMLMFAANNATMAELAMALQRVVLDRPVVNRTGLEDRYDFKLSFAPTGSEFGGTMHLATAEDSEASSLFTAVQAFGLKLEPVKTAVDVLVVDRVEKPSGN